MSMPYVGSEIELISNSDMRFQGILYSIKPDDSTVALEQVRSFGTEGRKGNPAEELPGSDQVFPYIVFKGSEIKDLYVISGPKMTDPASAQQPWGFGGLPPGMNPYYAQQAMAYHQQQQQQYWQMQQMGYQPNLPPSTNPSVGGNLAAPDVLESQVPQKSLPGFVAESHALPERHQAPPPTRSNGVEKTVEQNALAETPRGRAHVSKSGTGKELNIQLKLKNGGSRTDSEQKSAAPSFALPPKPMNAVSSDSNHSLALHPDKVRNGHGTATGHGNRAGPPRPKVTIPDSEFDFESSNAKFDKSSVLQENSQSTEPSYKKSSFFDDISCEVKDRMESRAFDGRARRQEEKTQNLETFGVAGTNRGRGGRRGGRGFRGRGGARRGGRSDGGQHTDVADR